MLFSFMEVRMSHSAEGLDLINNTLSSLKRFMESKPMSEGASKFIHLSVSKLVDRKCSIPPPNPTSASCNLTDIPSNSMLCIQLTPPSPKKVVINETIVTPIDPNVVVQENAVSGEKEMSREEEKCDLESNNIECNQTSATSQLLDNNTADRVSGSVNVTQFTESESPISEVKDVSLQTSDKCTVTSIIEDPITASSLSNGMHIDSLPTVSNDSHVCNELYQVKDVDCLVTSGDNGCEQQLNKESVENFSQSNLSVHNESASLIQENNDKVTQQRSQINESAGVVEVGMNVDALSTDLVNSSHSIGSVQRDERGQELPEVISSTDCINDNRGIQNEDTLASSSDYASCNESNSIICSVSGDINGCDGSYVVNESNRPNGDEHHTQMEESNQPEDTLASETNGSICTEVLKEVSSIFKSQGLDYKQRLSHDCNDGCEHENTLESNPSLEAIQESITTDPTDLSHMAQTKSAIIAHGDVIMEGDKHEGLKEFVEDKVLHSIHSTPSKGEEFELDKSDPLLMSNSTELLLSNDANQVIVPGKDHESISKPYEDVSTHSHHTQLTDDIGGNESKQAAPVLPGQSVELENHQQGDIILDSNQTAVDISKSMDQKSHTNQNTSLVQNQMINESCQEGTSILSNPALNSENCSYSASTVPSCMKPFRKPRQLNQPELPPYEEATSNRCPSSLEMRMKAILDELDKQTSSPVSSPKPVSLTSPTHETLHFSRVNFIYISNRGCADRIRLLISYLNHYRSLTRYLPSLVSTTLTVPEFNLYMKQKQLPSIIVPILEIYFHETPLLLFNDDPIYSFLLRTYHLTLSDPIQVIHDQNLESCCQFVNREFWWYQQSCEQINSDNKRIKVKKSFMTNVLFPSLQLIQTEYMQLPQIEFVKQEDMPIKLSRSLIASDLSVFSLLSALEDEFSIATELFTELNGFYLEMKQLPFVLECIRFYIVSLYTLLYNFIIPPYRYYLRILRIRF